MTVAEAIELLKTFPPEALLVHTYHSDYDELDSSAFSLLDGAADYARGGEGLIVHNGHLMKLRKGWWPANLAEFCDAPGKPGSPNFVKAVCIG